MPHSAPPSKKPRKADTSATHGEGRSPRGSRTQLVLRQKKQTLEASPRTPAKEIEKGKRKEELGALFQSAMLR